MASCGTFPELARWWRKKQRQGCTQWSRSGDGGFGGPTAMEKPQSTNPRTLLLSVTRYVSFCTLCCVLPLRTVSYVCTQTQGQFMPHAVHFRPISSRLVAYFDPCNNVNPLHRRLLSAWCRQLRCPISYCFCDDASSAHLFSNIQIFKFADCRRSCLLLAWLERLLELGTAAVPYLELVRTYCSVVAYFL